MLKTGKSKTELISKVQHGINSQNQYYNLFLQTQVGIVIFKGPDLVIEMINDALLEIWGKDKRVVGLPLMEALPEIAGTAYPLLLKEVYDTGISHHAKEYSAYLVRNGQPELVHFNFVYQPFYEPDGTIGGVMAVANEITEQVEARKEVEESEKKLRSLVMNADVATGIYIGEDMRIDMANDAMIRLWGKDESVIGKTIREALPELEGQPFHQLLQHVYTTGQTYKASEDRADLVVDGKLQSYYFNFSYKPLFDSQGKVYGILNMAVDVTENVMARQMLAKSEEQLKMAVEERTSALKISNENLERSNKELEQFAHVASHDMKEPIRKIKMFTDRLHNEFGDLFPERANLYFEKIEKATGRLVNMVEGVLHYSSLNAMEYSVEEIDLNDILKNIQEDFELQIEQKQAQLNFNIEHSFKGAPFLIYQLFYNIINNSLKFSRKDIPLVINITSSIIKGADLVEIETSNKEATFLKITVQDNGIGFKQANAEKIFNTFTRLNARDDYEGTGLGLTLCKRIVSRHNGMIKAKGEEGVGARFYIYLPL